MITKPEAIDEIRRMSNLDFFPADAKAAGELVTALQDVARSKEHAATIIREFVSSAVSGTKCPTATEIRRMAHSLDLKEYSRPSPTRCADCSDSGWKRKVVMRCGQPYDFATPCECRKVMA